MTAMPLLCSQMGTWIPKVNFLTFHNFYFPPTTLPHQFAKSKLVRKSEVLKIISLSKKSEHSLCPSLRASVWKDPDERLKNKIGDRVMTMLLLLFVCRPGNQTQGLMLSKCFTTELWPQPRWLAFKQEVYNLITEGCNLSGHLYAHYWELIYTEIKGRWLSRVPWSTNNVHDHEEFSLHIGRDRCSGVILGHWWF